MINIWFVSERLKRLNKDLLNNIPLILDTVTTYSEIKPLERKDSNAPLLYEEDINMAANVIRKIEGFNPTLLDSNLRSLTSSRLKAIHSADYDIIDNHVEIGSRNSIPHEMLHVASSFYDKDKDAIVSGFSLVADGITIGRPFTEGYTELLTIESFNPPDHVPSYSYFIKYAKLFRDNLPINMNKLYSEGNLYGLLEETSKLGISKEEILAYIYLLEKIKFFNIPLIEGYLNEYIEDFIHKTKKL